MKSHFRSAVRVLTGMTLMAAVGISSAQTPAQMEYDRQQREYRQQLERQREQQQQQQQLMNENARRQQEQSSRINAPAGQSPSYAPPATQGSSGAGGADPTGAQALSAARAMWEKRPALPPDRNPLLGKWTRPASTRTNSSDPFAAVFALAKGGLCEALFGGGVFEFRPDRLVGLDERTPPQELDRVEYRGDAKRVVVLPKKSLKLIEFDFEGPDRINWASQKCVLVRVGAASSSASAAAPATAASAAPASSAGSGTTAGGVIDFSVGAPSADNKVAGRMLWVLKQDAQVALIKGGLKSNPYASVLQNWMRACAERTPDCEKGIRALQVYSVGYITTDATGHAVTPPLPVGRYWVLSDTKIGDKKVMWNELVDVRAGTQSVTLDQRNALPVE
jgi:hypothetical protein